MKKIYLTLLITTLLMSKHYAQGSDVIFCIDNSGSVDGTEYAQMTASIQALIANVLSCNPNNRVAVVHYGTFFNGLPTTGPRIFIESDFTNNITNAQNFSRRLNSGDHYHEALGLIGNAIDNINNPSIVSTQQNLNRNPSNSLVVFLFTDALRSQGDIINGSYLVNFNSSANNSDAAFLNYTNFKNNRGAQFVVVHVSPNIQATNAAASIASLGGSYTSTIETYPADPDGNALPRYYLLKNNFILSGTEIDEVSQDICNISIDANIDLNPVNEVCPLFPLEITGNFTIPSGSTISGLTLQIINETGTPVGIPITNAIVTGNTFSFTINEGDFAITPPITGNFEFSINANVALNGSSINISDISANEGPDVSFENCSVCCPNCCVDNISLTSPVLANFVDTRQANLRIQAVNTINDGAFAIYHAGNFILLKDGFVAHSGSRVHVYNEGCTDQYILRSNDNYTTSNFKYRESFGNNINEDFKNEEGAVKVSPNPNRGIFNLSTENYKDGKIEVIDMYGITVYKSDFKNQNKVEINIEDNPRGIYILKVYTNNQIYTEKIIKE